MIKGIWDSRQVYINDRVLQPVYSQLVRNYSPDFNWGNMTSGSSQLSLALLLEYTNEEEASKLNDAFKRDIISELPTTDFEITSDVIYSFLKKYKTYTKYE